LLVGP